MKYFACCVQSVISIIHRKNDSYSTCLVSPVDCKCIKQALSEIENIIFANKCADPGSFVKGGPTLTSLFCYFLVDEGREDKRAIIIKGVAFFPLTLVKAFRIIPEFRILRMTLHRKSA